MGTISIPTSRYRSKTQDGVQKHIIIMRTWFRRDRS